MIVALEPRLMFDGAAVADAVHEVAVAEARPVPDAPAPVQVRSADPSQNGGRVEVAFVDKSVADYQKIVDNLHAGVEVELIDGGQSGLAQMAKWAETHTGYDAIHVVSHGAEGLLSLGTDKVNAATLSESATQAELAEIGHALKDDGDLLLYGCDIAADESGKAFAANLASATGADVAASDDVTGKSGDWDLEYRTSTIETRALDFPAYDGDLSVSATPGATQLTTGGGYIVESMTTLSDGNLAICYLKAQKAYIGIYSTSGSLISTSEITSTINASGDSHAFSYTANDYIKIASISGNKIAAHWFSRASSYNIYFAIFDNTGTPTSSAIKVNAGTSSTLSVMGGEMAELSNGDLAFVYSTHDNSDYYSYARVFSSSGAAVTAEKTIGVHNGFQIGVTSDGAGGFLATKNEETTTSVFQMTYTGGAITIGQSASVNFHSVESGISRLSGNTYVVSTSGKMYFYDKSLNTFTYKDDTVVSDVASILPAPGGGFYNVLAEYVNYFITEYTSSGTKVGSTTSYEGYANELTYVTREIVATDRGLLIATTDFDGNIFLLDSNPVTGPNITSGTTVSVAENISTSTAVYTAAATATGGTLVWDALTGTDAASFNFNTSTGVLTFKNSPNYESKNSYSVTINAHDDNGSVSKTVTVSVTNVNEAPSFTSGATASVSENASGTVYTATSTDPDAGATATYSIAPGGDGALFSINSSTGALTFNAPPNFEAPGDADTNSTYVVNVRVTDGANPVDQAVTITVTNVNEAPVNTVPGTRTIAEDGALVLSSNALSVTDQDAGTTLTTTVSVAAGKGVLAVTTGGGGTITGNGSNSVQIVGTVAQVQAALASVTYTPTADAHGTGYATLTMTSSDGTLSDTDTVTINVTAVADTPSVTNSSTTPGIQSSSGLVLTKNAADGTEVGYFKITGITGGTLYKNNGTTQITNGMFITDVEGSAGLKFTPSGGGNGSFTAQASTSAVDAGLGGSTVTATIAVGMAVASPTIAEDAASGTVAITQGGAETHYKITGITGGRLYSDAGLTTEITDGTFISAAGTTTNVYFVPTAHRNSTTGGNASFVAQAATTNADGGLFGSAVTSTITLTPVADTPSVANPTIAEDADSGAIAITRSANDGAETTHYKITAITGGTLYSDAAFTQQITEGGFVASAGAVTNVYFRPTANRNGTTGGNGSFTVQAAYDADGGSPTNATLGGSTVTSTVTITPVADTPTVVSPTVNEDIDSGAIAITRSANDGAETTHYKITGITGGALYSDAGFTQQITDGSFIASAGATTNVYFRPAADRNSTTGGNGSFTVQASSSNVDAGLAGSTATSTITLTPVADTPSVTNASTTPATQTTSGLVLSRNAVDGAEVTHFKITGITNGTLWYDPDGPGALPLVQINNGDFITYAQGNAGLKFTPTGGGNGSFTAQASTSAADGGLGGSTIDATITVGMAVADVTLNEDAASGTVAITRGNAETHYKITGITGGRLYADAGLTTEIISGSFIANAGATTNVYFVPTADRNATTGGNGGFTAQASSAANDAGLEGSAVTNSITLTAIADTPTISSHTVAEDTASQAVVITRATGDGAETSHYKVTGITGGTLYSDAALTTQINNNDFVASGGATTTVYFKPTANRNSTTGGNGAFTVQASKSNVDGGLGGATVTSTLTLTPVADTPTVASPTVNEDTDTGAIAITRSASDGTETNHYKITGITGGRLYADSAYTTEITNGSFIASAGATTNVYFRPTANGNSTTGGNGSFTVQASSSNVDAGLGGNTATSTITLTPVADTPSVTNAGTSPDTQTTTGLVLSRATVDGAETTHFKITGITGGTLYKNDGVTQINNGDFITFAEGNAGLKFTPANGATTGAFTAQASKAANDGGLGGGTVNAAVTVNTAPTANGAALSPPAGQVGTDYSFGLPTGTFTDPDVGDTLTYTATGLPPGLSINAQTGAISGNPSASGTSTVTITVTDSRGATATKTLSVSVQPAPIPAPPPPAPPPVVEAPKPAPVVDNGPVASLVTVVRDSTTTTTTTTTTTFQAPTVGATGPAQVTVVPAVLTAPASQAFQVAVAVKPAGGSDALVVNAPVRDAVIAEGSRISVTVPSEAFAHTKADAVVTLQATRANGAALPGWMAFNPQTGTFEGTPPPGFRGEVVVKVIARDKDGREAVQTFKIVVGQGNIAPGQGGEGRGQGEGEGQGRPQGEGKGQGQGAPSRSGDAGPRDVGKLAARPMGRASLTDQLRELSQEGRLAKQAALFGIKRGKAA